MNTKTLMAAAALMAAASAQASLSVGSTNYTYSESFDTLTQATTAQPWANNSTLPGWSLFIGSGAAAPTLLGGTGSSNAGSFFSFGAANASDRALGGVGSGGAYFGAPATNAVAGFIAVAFSNNSGADLAGFSIGFSGEQWRDGGSTTPAAQGMVMEYGFGSSFASVTSWVAPGGSFNWSSPVFTNAGSGAAVNGNAAGLVTGLGGSISAAWAAGDTLWVRWIDVNNQGNDHGLAIDNLSFSVTPVPEPGTWALLLAGLGAVGLLARRRRA